MKLRIRLGSHFCIGEGPHPMKPVLKLANQSRGKQTHDLQNSAQLSIT